MEKAVNPPKAKSQPRPTDTSKAFWDGAANGEFMLQVSSLTGRAQFFPRAHGLQAMEPTQWKAACGRGTLRAFTLCRVAAPGFEGEAPYVMGIVQLEEGPRVLSQIVRIAPADLKVGLLVQLAWDKERAGPPMFQFGPV